MEQIIAFVLGISVGLLVITLISLVRDVLKMKKETAKVGADLKDAFNRLEEIDHNFCKRLDDFYDSTHKDLQELNNELRKINQELESYLHQRIDEVIHHNEENFNSSMRRTDELNRYVDKRFDQTTSTLREYVDKRTDSIVDVLCTRMDIKFEEKPEYNRIENHDLERATMLKS